MEKIDKILIGILVFILLCIVYTLVEPFIYAYTGFGFLWDYNTSYEVS